MASPAAVLSILVEVNNKMADARLSQTQAKLAETSGEATALGSASSKAASGLKTLGTVAKIGAAAGVAAFAIEAKRSVQTTQDLTKSTLSLHKNLGLTNKTASEWAGLARARGADTTKLGMAFKTLATQISSAGHGSVTSIAMFKELGFSQRDIQKAMTDTEFATKKVADGLNALPAGADKATIASKLFGRGWQTIAPVLRDGSAAMQEQLDTVEKYGGVLQGKTLKQQEALLANIRENKIAWQGFQVELAKFVTPALNVVSNQFQRIAAINARKDLTDPEKWHKIAAIIQQDLQKALNFVLKLIPTIASNVGKAAPQIAVALIQGFLNADAWGKLALGAWLFTKLGLTKAVLGAIGTRISTTIATSVAEGEGMAAAGAASGAILGGAIAVGAGAAIGVWFEHHFNLADHLFKGRTATRADVQAADKLQPFIEQLRTMTRKAQDKLFAESQQGLHQFSGLWIQAYRKIHTVSLSELAKLAQQTHNGFTRIVTDADHQGQNAFANWVGWQKKRNKLSAAYNYDLFLQTTTELGKTANAHDREGKQAYQNWTGWMNKTQQSSGQSTSGIEKETGKDLAGAAEKGTEGAKKLKAGVGGNYLTLASITKQGLQNIADNTNKSLGALGAKKLAFALKDAAKGVGNLVQGLQAGGTIVPGKGSGDKVPAMLEPGEVVLNRELVARMGGAQQANRLNQMVPRFAKGGTVGGMSTMISEVNKFESHHFPYAWGGGHSHFGIEPVDCSGFVSDVLHSGGLLGTPMVSGSLMNWGKPGKGPLTVYANPEHTFMSLNGRFAGTSSSNPGGGAGWVDGGYPSSYLAGFVARTMGVSGAVAKQIARQIIKGPKGPLRDIGQRSLDKVRGAANALISRKTPKGSFGGGDKAVADAAGLPASLQRYNHVWKKHWAPDFGGPTMPLSKIAELAEWAGHGRVPGQTMAQVTIGESGSRPGSGGTDPGGTQGWGLWAITSPFNNALVNSLGGYPAMLNPILNAQAMASIYEGQGLGAWYGTGSVTSTNAHYTGPMKQRGGIVGMQRGGIAKMAGGGISGPGVKSIPRILNAFKLIGGLRRKEKGLEDSIAYQTTRFGWAGSEAGTDMSAGEQGRLVLGNTILLGDYLRERGLTKHFLKATAKVKLSPGVRSGMKSRLRDLEGPSGLIFSTRDTLAGLKVPLTTATAAVGPDTSALLGISQSQLQAAQQQLAVSQAQYPVFSGMASGGVVPAAASSGSAPEVHVHIADGMGWLQSFVSTEVRSSDRRSISKSRRRS